MIYEKDLLIKLGFSKEFNDFLKKHNALLRFISAVNKFAYDDNHNIHIPSSENYVISTFIWYKTEEGFAYWKDINRKWSKKYRELKTK